MRLFLSAVGLLAVAAMASPALANDLVQNGGFESGNFNDWTLGNQNGGSSIVEGVYTYNNPNGFVGNYAPHSGDYEALLGASGADGTLSQTIADTSGQMLVLSYWLASDGGLPNNFSVDWNGVEIAGSALNSIQLSGYVEYTFDVMATGSDTLAFVSEDDPGYLSLDDVCLGQAGSCAVPEPGTLALFGAGLVAAVGMVRRRKRTPQAFLAPFIV